MNRNGAPTGPSAYAELRADILTGRQPPGTRLPFAELTARYQASMGVVREALTRLAAEGLVESEPQYGHRVMPLSVADLNHLTDARRAIEPLVLRQAIERGGLAWESEVLAAHHRLERTRSWPPATPARLVRRLDHRPRRLPRHPAVRLPQPPPARHRRIAPRRRRAHRQWSVALAHSDRDIAAEHRAILNAVLAHDVGKATAALTTHIQNTTNVLLDQASTEPNDAATA